MRRIKDACVAIGLTEKGKDDDPVPLAVAGSGFFISEGGNVMTAAHVVDRCYRAREALKNEGKLVDISVLRVETNEKSAALTKAPLIDVGALALPEAFNYFGPRDLDICIGRVRTKDKCTYLPIKNPDQQLDLYSDVIMCGYPRGEETLDVNGQYSVPRFNPVVQFGKISGFMPTDDHPSRIALQTDIVGTAGSSGSPIVDPKDGAVVAMAQRVSTAPIRGDRDSDSLVNAIAVVGLVYGVSCGAFYDFATRYDTIRLTPGQVSLKVKHPTVVSREVHVNRLPEN